MFSYSLLWRALCRRHSYWLCCAEVNRSKLSLTPPHSITFDVYSHHNPRHSHGCRFLEIWWGCGSASITPNAQLHQRLCEFICTCASFSGGVLISAKSWCTTAECTSSTVKLGYKNSSQHPHNCITLSLRLLPSNWWLSQIYIWLTCIVKYT